MDRLGSLVNVSRRKQNGSDPAPDPVRITPSPPRGIFPHQGLEAFFELALVSRK